MVFYADCGVKEQAVNDLVALVSAKNKSLGDRLLASRKVIYRTAIVNIQKIGVHDYAEELLKRNSFSRYEIEKTMKGEEICLNELLPKF